MTNNVFAVIDNLGHISSNQLHPIMLQLKMVRDHMIVCEKPYKIDGLSFHVVDAIENIPRCVLVVFKG